MKRALSFLLLLTLVSCGQREKSETPQPSADFTAYVSAYTSGVISSASVIRILLTEDVGDTVAGARADKGLFSFTPSLDGTAYWINPHTLEFRPSQPLPPGTTFRAVFHLGKVMQVPKELRDFPFSFSTFHQGVKVEPGGLRGLSDRDLTWQRFTGTLVTADVAPPARVEQVLKATQDGRTLPIRWEHNERGTRHRFIVDSIRRTEKKEVVILSWDATPLGADDRGSRRIEVPPLNEFRLMNLRTTQEGGQRIDLYFSDPVSTEQQLDGLIYFPDGPEVRLVRSGNIIRVYPSERMVKPATLVILPSLRNILGYRLGQRYTEEITFTSLKPAVEILGKGVILPSSNGLVLPFRAVSLKAVNVKVVKIYEKNIPQFLQVNQFDGSNELRRVGRLILKKEIRLVSDRPIDYSVWNVFSLDLSSLIRPDPGAIYRVTLSFTREQSLYPCGDVAQEEETETGTPATDEEYAVYDGPNSGDERYTYYDDYDPSWNYEEYDWRERDNPCSPSYYMFNNRSATRNVLASDLGIIAKEGGDKHLLITVTHLVDARPLEGVEVEVYDYQHQLLTSGRTGKDGMVTLTVPRKPFLVVAHWEGQRGYLRIDDGSALPVSMFDVSGVKAPKGVKGFLYGERDVWRPGDSLYLTFILEDRNHVLPPDHPVILEVYTPENRLYLRRVTTRSLHGVYSFRIRTGADAPTGRWLARVRVGDLLFTRTLRIETVKPNRLKIRLDFGKELLTRGSDNRCTLHAAWLHGATARNLKAQVLMTLTPAHTTFAGYEEYVFDDPSKEFYAEEEEVFRGRLGNEGDATFLPGIEVGDEAPGMLKASFKTRVFEPSGDFSEDRFSILYSPYSEYVGVKIPRGPGWNGALYSNEPNLLPVVTLNERGKPVDRTLIVEIYRVGWRWWWDRTGNDNLAGYVQKRSRYLIRTDKITTRHGKAFYEMKFDRELWGRYLIRILDPASGHSCGSIFYLTYKGWWEQNTQEGPGGAEMLMFSIDKKSYHPGEKIRVKLPAFREGRALVTVENGSRILQRQWKEADGDSLLVIEATPEMAPNAYICIELIQPHHRTTNDRPIRMYGILPVEVIDPATRLEPEIVMPASLEPESKAVIRIREKKGRPMTYTLALVDEGLLDLTRYATPDPWRHFYAREALGVKTWDLYKYVLGAYGGRMAGLISIGGDTYMELSGKKNTNRFPPVVLFYGPFELKGGRTATHTIRMPNYVGAVRAMVVAADGEGAYGHAEKTVPVKKPLMVLATLPRVVGPGERVTLPVTVFAMEEKVRKVNVHVEVNELFTVEGPSSQTLRFDRPGDRLVFFTLQVAGHPGEGQVRVTATAPGEEAHDVVLLKVRAPNPRITQVTAVAVGRGATWTGRYDPPGMPGTRRGVLEVSVIPSLRLGERLDYLIHYPYGCVEQVISSAFPQLYLDRLVALDKQQEEEIQKNITSVLSRLSSFQTAGGGFTYWPGSGGPPDEWATSYAGHFLLEARNRGYDLPPALLDGWLRYQRRMANSWSRAVKRQWWHSSEMVQAYRLYTLALAGHPAAAAMNRMREMQELSPAARWRLAGAYLLAGKEKAARALVQGISTTVREYDHPGPTYGSALRDEAMILEVLTLMNDRTRAKKMVDHLTNTLNSDRWYSTQTTAWALLALGKFVGEEGTTDKLAFTCTINGKEQKVSAGTPVVRLPLTFPGGRGGTVSITNPGQHTLYINLIVSGVPPAGEEQAVSSDYLTMHISYANMRGEPVDPTRLAQGTDFYVDVTLHNTGMLGDYQQMALTQIFPSGWEIRNVRLDNSEELLRDQPDYQDIRDDRVYTFFNLRRNETKTFRILLNATYLGRFYMPAVRCEAMYDHSIAAVQPGRWVEVVEQQ